MNAILTMNQIAALLQVTPCILQAELDALPDDIIRFRPAPGEWCVNEVIGHLIEIEKRGFAEHIRRILASEGPYTAQAWDPEQVARDRHDDEKSPQALLAEFTALRKERIEWVLALQPEQLGQNGHFPAVGDLSVSDLLHMWMNHDRNHIKQIAKALALVCVLHFI